MGKNMDGEVKRSEGRKPCERGSYVDEDFLNEKTLWRSEPATIDGNKVSYGVPGDAKYFYVNVYDDRGFVVTSRLIANISE